MGYVSYCLDRHLFIWPYDLKGGKIPLNIYMGSQHVFLHIDTLIFHHVKIVLSSELGLKLLSYIEKKDVMCTNSPSSKASLCTCYHSPFITLQVM